MAGYKERHGDNRIHMFNSFYVWLANSRYTKHLQNASDEVLSARNHNPV